MQISSAENRSNFSHLIKKISKCRFIYLNSAWNDIKMSTDKPSIDPVVLGIFPGLAENTVKFKSFHINFVSGMLEIL